MAHQSIYTLVAHTRTHTPQLQSPPLEHVPPVAQSGEKNYIGKEEVYQIHKINKIPIDFLSLTSIHNAREV